MRVDWRSGYVATARIVDADGREYEHIEVCDTDTGKMTQLVRENGLFQVRSGDLVRRTFFAPAPLQVLPRNETRGSDGKT